MAKLLIYSDGACTNNGWDNAEICGSYAAYDVSPELNWRGTRASDNHMSLLNETPLEVQHRVQLPYFSNERPTNNLAEVKTLELAVMWANNYIKRHQEYSEIEFCLDSQLVLNQVQGVYAVRNAPLRKVYIRIHTILDRFDKKNVNVRWTWIPGDLMKQTIIKH